MMYIEIDGADYSSQIDQRNIRVPDQLNERTQVDFLLKGTASDRPKLGHDVVFYDSNSKINKKFAGIIEDIYEQEHGAKLKWDITVVSYERILDRFLVPQTYTGQNCGYIIKDAISSYVPATEGLTVNNVEDGVTIEKAVFGYDWTVARALDKLAEITGYFWYIDYDKDVHFEDRTKNDAAFDIGETTNIYDFAVENTRGKYRNQQYIRAGEGTSTEITEGFAGDGETRTWHVRRPVAEEPTISINGTPLDASEVGIYDVEEDKKYYWNKGETQIIQDFGETKLTETDTVEITYKYLYPIRIFSELGGEIEDRKAIEGNSGQYAHVADRKYINNSDAAQQEGEGLLAKYGEIPERIRYFTFEDGLQAGQLQNIVRSKHDVDGNYLISKVTMRPRGWSGGTFKFGYEIEALNGDQVGSWIDFFRNIADAGKDFVIRENEVLIKIKSFNEVLQVSDTLTIDTDTYETRVNYAQINYSEISKNQNLVGLTETNAEFTSIRNGEGSTETPDTDYKTLNIGGLTESTSADNEDVNVIGLTEPDEAIDGADWAWVEGVSSPYES